MASEVFFTHHHQHHRHRDDWTSSRLYYGDNFAQAGPSSRPAGPVRLQRSVGTSRSGSALTFPPLHLDPTDSSHGQDPATNPNATGANGAHQAGNFVLGSTFYHHPELNALVSNHLADSSANAFGTAAGGGSNFLNGIFGGPGLHDDESDGEDGFGGGGPEAVSALPQPKISSEFIALNEDLVPASLDIHGDMLPADQHPSYPFGNLFGPSGGMIAADSAIVGGGSHMSSSLSNAAASLGAGLGETIASLGLDFGGGLNSFINVGQASHGRRGAVASSWNTFTNKGSRSKIVGAAGAATEWNPSTESRRDPVSFSNRVLSSSSAKDADQQAELVRSARQLGLAPYLLFRTSTSTVLTPPTWPFRRHGPGSTSYAALLRPNSNIHGSGPASQAVAATLGGLPASAKIIKEVWSDLALEELVPLNVGTTSASRHTFNGNDDLEAEEEIAGKTGAGDKKRRRTDPDPDSVFAKRIATMEPDPLDLLGPVSREIRGQVSQSWGTGAPSRRAASRRRPSQNANHSEDEAAETEHDDSEQGYRNRDQLRYGFQLPPAPFSWYEHPEDGPEASDRESSPTLHVEPDGIGWSTAKRIFVNEQRDRILPDIASRNRQSGGSNDQVAGYQVRGLRANTGLLPRPDWSWADGPVQESQPDEMSMTTEISASASHPTGLGTLDRRVNRDDEGSRYIDEDRSDYGKEGEADEWEADEEELQRALFQQYEGNNEADNIEADGQVDEQDVLSSEAEAEEEEDDGEMEDDLDAGIEDYDEDDEVASYTDDDDHEQEN